MNDLSTPADPKKTKSKAGDAEEINAICTAIRQLTEADFKAIEELIERQMHYVHPLKMATASKINDLGEQNMKVIKLLRELQKEIKEVGKIMRRKVKKY